MHVTGRLAFALAFSAMMSGSSIAATAPPSATASSPQALAGEYNGSQPEIAAGLELGSDGRFRYGLSYGALDEQAQGRWEYDGAEVRLTSDRIMPPRFRLRRVERLTEARLRIDLDLPGSMSRSFFTARIVMANGSALEQRFARDGIDLVLGPLDRPVSVAVMLPIYGFTGNPVRLPGGPGAAVRFRFEPNGLGQVAFSHAPLRIDHGDLLLERHGRLIRFRRRAAGDQ